jgi:serine/threonine-protein kinase
MKVTLLVEEGPNKGAAFDFYEHEALIVGRSNRACYRLPVKDRYLSRFHFLIEINPPDCVVINMNSRSGTWVNGVRVSRAELQHGDQIRAGHTLFQVRFVGSEAGEEQAPTVPWVPPTGFEQLPDEFIRRTILESRAVKPPTGPEQLPDEFPRIPGYRLESVLGQGAMGIVYRAQREKDGTTIALKTIQPRRKASVAVVERFLRETALHCRLSHPHIVQFHQNGEADGLLYFEMEYVAGTDGARAVKHGPLPIPRAVGLACQLLEALAHAHERGIVHRDVKPANLLITRREDQVWVKLADFGLARLYLASTLSGLSMTGDVGGTVAYMAPEQVADLRHAGPPADQYSAATTLYYLLTGQCAYRLQGALQEQLRVIVDSRPIPIRRIRAEIPDELAAVIHRAMEKRPIARYPDVAALQTALHPFR